MTATERTYLTPEHAAILMKRAGQKYRPSNGTEGDFFMNAWCKDCTKRGNGDTGNDCNIIILSFAFNLEDKEYPKEIQIAEDGHPCCTAFSDQAPMTEADKKYLEWKAMQSSDKDTGEKS